MEAKGVVAASAPQWIPVTERLPEQGSTVIVFVDHPKGGFLGTDWLDDDGEWYWNSPHPISHWMPLPAPPKAGD